MRRNDIFAPIHFYATAPYMCSYLPERTARSQVAFTEISAAAASAKDSALTAAYGTLVQHGFRRSGTFIYRPHCDDCHACVPVRLPVERFAPARGQRRAMLRHAGLIARECPPEFSEEHFFLYRRYLRARHTGDGMDGDSCEQYIQFLLQSPVDTFLVEFRDGGSLRMVSVIDRLGDGLSSVYTFYDPDLPRASFGTYGILWQIEACRHLRLPYLYLGYWIAENRKMAYKIRFRPIEGYRRGQWLEISGEELSPDMAAP